MMDSNLFAAVMLCMLATLVWILMVLQDIRFRLSKGTSTTTNTPLRTAAESPKYRILNSSTPPSPQPSSVRTTPIQSMSVYADGDYNSAPQSNIEFSTSGRGWTGQSAVRNTAGIDISDFLG